MWYDVFRKVSNKKDLQRLIDSAVDRGWTHEVQKNGRHRLIWPHVTDKSKGNAVVISSTLSDHRGFKNAQSDLARMERAWPAPTEGPKLSSFRVWAERSREDIIDQVKKLHALATSTSAQPGEKENAAKFRDTLIKKHNITSKEFGTFLPDSAKTTPAPTAPKKTTIDVDTLTSLLGKLYGKA